MRLSFLPMREREISFNHLRSSHFYTEISIFIILNLFFLLTRYKTIVWQSTRVFLQLAQPTVPGMLRSSHRGLEQIISQRLWLP